MEVVNGRLKETVLLLLISEAKKDSSDFSWSLYSTPTCNKALLMQECIFKKRTNLACIIETFVWHRLGT